MWRIYGRLIARAPSPFLHHQRLHTHHSPPPLKRHLWPLTTLGILLGTLEPAQGKDLKAVPQTQDEFVPDVDANQQSQNLTENILPIDLDKVISNEHTARWRVFTDMGRDLFSKGRLAESESYFLQALEEAKKGFGENDPHVASSCNNLAELFRMKKEFDKAESLYLEAISRLEKTMGSEHESVGFALHNLAGLYLQQRNMEKARDCYEQALQIAGKRLGLNHPEYANTMFHLGQVLWIMGKPTDAEALIQDSVRILEESGAGNSKVAIRRMGHLAEMLVRSSHLEEAENLQRKIVRILDMTEGPEASSTIQALENLANTLLVHHKLDEAEDLFQRCFEVKQKVFQSDNIQLWTPLFKLGSIALEKGSLLARKNDSLSASVQYEKAEEFLHQALSIAEKNWKDHCATSGPVGTFKRHNPSGVSAQPFHTQGFLAVVRSLAAIGDVGVHKSGLPGYSENELDAIRSEAEAALRRCQALVKKPECTQFLSLPVVGKEYAKCLQNLAKLLSITKHVSEVSSLKEKECQQLLQEATTFGAEVSR